MGVTYQHPIEAFIVSEVITSTSYTLTMTIKDTDDLMNVYENPMVFYLFDGVSIIYTQSLNVEYNTIEFPYLNPSTTYEYAIASTYDLLDGFSLRSFIAAQARFTTKDIVTIDSVFPLQDSISFELTINDARKVGFLSAIELYQNETLIESLTDLNVRKFENLQSNTEYTIKVTYRYDLNEGNGEKNIEYNTNITIAAFNVSYYSVTNVDYDSQNYIILNPGEEITNIFINQNYTSILTSNNRVLIWGNNDLGQLGDGSNNNSTVPIDITDSFNLDNDYIKQISMAPYSASAISSKGRLFTWGDGNNSPEDITYLFNLETDEIITSVFQNMYKNLVITSNGRIFEWDLFKLIKTRDITNLFNLDEAESIVKTVSGGFHYLFLTSKGKIITLGENMYGQLGNDSTVSSEIPLDITNTFDFLDDEVIVDIGIGSFHSMSITSSNRVFSWGSNLNGQLGDGTFESSSIPIDITNNFSLSEEEIITKIFAGGGSSFAITSENQIFTWGMKFVDAGGQMSVIGSINIPQTFNEEFSLANNENIVDIYSNGNSFIAFTSIDEYLVWGKNDFGQIAIGSFSILTSPQDLPVFNTELLDDVEYYYNETITEYIPTKEGYIFGGWYTDLTFITKYVYSTMPAEDFILYAKWIKIE